jgi:hypothetical protein
VGTEPTGGDCFRLLIINHRMRAGYGPWEQASREIGSIYDSSLNESSAKIHGSAQFSRSTDRYRIKRSRGDHTSSLGDGQILLCLAMTLAQQRQVVPEDWANLLDVALFFNKCGKLHAGNSECGESHGNFP